MKLLTRFLLGAGMVTAVAAGGCEDTDGIGGVVPKPVASNFGPTFAAAFAAPANSEPIDVDADDLTVDPTADPIDV